MFPTTELNARPPPDHLRRIASTSVADIAATVCAKFGRPCRWPWPSSSRG